MTGKRVVATAAAPKAIGPYSQAVRSGTLLFVSGQLPLTPEGEMAPGGVPEQTQRVLENLRAILEAEGLGFEHVVKATVFMTDLKQFAAMNEVYARFFASDPPARAAVQVAALPRGAQVEIEAVAAV